MSLRDLNSRTRSRLRFHGWVLTLWCLALGMLASWLLLHVLGLRSPAARYASSAVVMYSLGLVVGTRYWLSHFSESVREEAGALGAADATERARFDAEQMSHKPLEGSRKAFDWSDLLGGLADLCSFEELSIVLLIPALVLAAFGLLMLTGTLPMLLVDGLAALLAEMAVQFVFGALLVRGVMRPQHHDAAFMHIVGKTWAVGVLLVVVSAAAGWGLTQLAPGAASIGDLFRGARP